MVHARFNGHAPHRHDEEVCVEAPHRRKHCAKRVEVGRLAHAVPLAFLRKLDRQRHVQRRAASCATTDFIGVARIVWKLLVGVRVHRAVEDVLRWHTAETALSCGHDYAVEALCREENRYADESRGGAHRPFPEDGLRAIPVMIIHVDDRNSAAPGRDDFSGAAARKVLGGDGGIVVVTKTSSRLTPGVVTRRAAESVR
eukprot:SAG11_NODE_3362_length_2499_cov_1.650417_1_plen_199_part_00